MKAPPDEAPLATDRAWAFDAVEDVSRTFALSIKLLEPPIDEWVCTGYLLCRIADTIEDEPSIAPADRARLLETYDATLDPDGDVDVGSFLEAAGRVRPADAGADWAVLDQSDRVIRLFDSFDPTVRRAMRSLVREMTTGMATFLRRYDHRSGLRLQTVEELEEYCWCVAGTVGTLFTNLLACLDRGRSVEPDPDDAWSFALLLQLVNVAKDVRADYETEGNVYLPGEWLAAEGIDHEAVGDPAKTSRVVNVVERVVDRAESHGPGARRYLATIPTEEEGLLEAAALPYLLALGTVRELRNRTTEAVTEATSVKLDRSEVRALYGRMERGIDQEELTRLAAAVRRGRFAPDGSVQ